MSLTHQSNLCQSCKATSQLYDAWVVGERSGGLKALLDQYKFSSARAVSSVAATLLDSCLPLLPNNVVIVPVPTVPSHQRVRGFDHTALIAKRLAKQRGMYYRPVLATSDRSTQHLKSRTERLKADLSHLRVTHDVPPVVLLIDDIYTTGSTFLTTARKLHEAGAETIYGAVIARQTLDAAADL